MKNIEIRNGEGIGKYDVIVTYKLEEIKTIEYGLLKDFHSEDDIYGNGYEPENKALLITFKNGEYATFVNNRYITFS